MIWALGIQYSPAIWLGKAALLLQMIRIFTPMKTGPIYWLIHALLWGNLVLYIPLFMIAIFQCAQAPDIFWNPVYNGNHCLSSKGKPIISGVFNAISDLLNLLLPLWAILRLQMATKRKIGIGAIFATGMM